jgi:FAD:protein FMN transferase
MMQTERTEIVATSWTQMKHRRIHAGSNIQNLCSIRVHLGPLLLLVLVAAVRAETPLARYSFSEIHMGCQWKIVLYAADKAVANRAARAAYDRVEELNRVLSDYDPESELSRLSDSAPSREPVQTSDDLWRVLEFSQQLSAKSDGAFDITVGPLVKLWRRARRTKEMPRADLLAEAREATDYRALKLDPAAQSAQLMKPHMRLDAGGIGMGYSVDEALVVLKRQGIANALVDASGDIGVSEAPPGERGWRIAIEPPKGSGRASRWVNLKNYAITTSGDAFQALEIDGKRYSHIVDPRTGLGITGRSAVTVISPNCITADSYTKPICILGPQAGFKLIEDALGAAAFVEREIDDPSGNTKIESLESKRFHEFVISQE